MPKAPTPLEKTLDTFVDLADKAKVAIIVPLFGYWADSKSPQLDQKTLKLTLDRLYSTLHNVYLFFVAEERRLTPDVGNVILGKSKGGNSTGVAMPKGSTYGEYLRAGINAALEDTKCQYVICINPWVLLQHNALDTLIGRINRDDIQIVSGFDVNGIIDDSAFEGHIYNLPSEQRGIDDNLFGMKRSTAEIITFDPKFKTHYFIARDVWQTAYSRGFESITSQRIPIFSFNVDWTKFESPAQFEADKAHFAAKWHYNDDSIKYGK